MSKLLTTRLPIASDEVTPELFNRLVRILEINLGSFDPNNTLQLTEAERDELNFNEGSLIFNTSTNSLQLFDGVEFVNLSTPFALLTVTNENVKFPAFLTSSLGAVTITIS